VISSGLADTPQNTFHAASSMEKTHPHLKMMGTRGDILPRNGVVEEGCAIVPQKGGGA
jgi:hypothetical protein